MMATLAFNELRQGQVIILEESRPAFHKEFPLKLISLVTGLSQILNLN